MIARRHISLWLLLAVAGTLRIIAGAARVPNHLFDDAYIAVPRVSPTPAVRKRLDGSCGPASIAPTTSSSCPERTMTAADGSEDDVRWVREHYALAEQFDEPGLPISVLFRTDSPRIVLTR